MQPDIMRKPKFIPVIDHSLAYEWCIYCKDNGLVTINFSPLNKLPGHLKTLRIHEYLVVKTHADDTSESRSSSVLVVIHIDMFNFGN